MKSVPAKEGCGSQGVIGRSVGEHQFHYSPRAILVNRQATPRPPAATVFALGLAEPVPALGLAVASPYPRIGRRQSLPSDWPSSVPALGLVAPVRAVGLTASTASRQPSECDALCSDPGPTTTASPGLARGVVDSRFSLFLENQNKV